MRLASTLEPVDLRTTFFGAPEGRVGVADGVIIVEPEAGIAALAELPLALVVILAAKSLAGTMALPVDGLGCLLSFRGGFCRGRDVEATSFEGELRREAFFPAP